MKKKKFAYVCSPYAGNVQLNRKNALIYSQHLYSLGYIPICVHNYVNEHCNLNEKTEREKILDVCVEMVKICDILFIFGNVVSSGMQREIDTAMENDVIVKRFENGRER